MMPLISSRRVIDDREVSKTYIHVLDYRQQKVVHRDSVNTGNGRKPWKEKII